LKHSVFLCLLLWLLLGSLACGKKGPPLAPLNLVPEPAANVTARRLGSTVYLQMSVPAKNANGPGPVAVDHLEIYAVTAAPGAVPPPNREFLTSSRVIARIPVKPPVDPDEPVAEDAPKDTRPAPGDTVTFVETITEEQLKPDILPVAKPAASAKTTSSAAGAALPTLPALQPLRELPGTVEPPPALPEVPAAGGTSIGGAPSAPPSPAAASAAAAPAPAAAPPAAAPIAVISRIYMVRGITRGGRPGAPSTRVAVPLIPPPPRATALATSFKETDVTVTWLPPVLEIGSTRAVKNYNVYAATATTEASSDAAPRPLNDKPLDALTFAHAGAEPGVEQCFVVRTVETAGGATLESDPSVTACVTPRDIFPPAAPKALSAVAGPGAVNLIWDANTEGDLVGYLILRAEAPGDTLQPLNSAPSRETRYRDVTVTPGTHYVYAILAVDRAGNRSAPSPRVEETAR
jgi:predicted small lipoprotein YifL